MLKIAGSYNSQGSSTKHVDHGIHLLSDADIAEIKHKIMRTHEIYYLAPKYPL